MSDQRILKDAVRREMDISTRPLKFTVKSREREGSVWESGA